MASRRAVRGRRRARALSADEADPWTRLGKHQCVPCCFTKSSYQINLRLQVLERLVLMSAASQRGCGQRLYFGNLDPQVLHARGAAHSRLLHSLLLRRR